MKKALQGKRNEAIHVYDGPLQRREGGRTVPVNFFGFTTRVM